MLDQIRKMHERFDYGVFFKVTRETSDKKEVIIYSNRDSRSKW
jgi:hypothetical protein